MSSTICAECNTIPTAHFCSGCSKPVCSICCGKRGLENLKICQDCHKPPSDASISPHPVKPVEDSTAAAHAHSTNDDDNNLPDTDSSPNNNPKNTNNLPPNRSERTLKDPPVSTATAKEANEEDPTDNLASSQCTTENTEETTLRPPPKGKRKNRKSKSPPQPTSRTKSSAAKKVRIGKGVRVKIQRQQLYHILENDAQRAKIPKDAGNSYNFYATVVGGTSHKGWDISIDMLPHGNKVLKRVTRTRLKVLQPGEEEKYYDKPPHIQKIQDGIMAGDGQSDDEGNNASTGKQGEAKKKKETASQESIRLFLEKPRDDIATATDFEYKYLQQKVVKTLKWNILSDTEYIKNNNKIDLPDGNDEDDCSPKLLKEIDWENLNDAFFDTVFPSVTGHGAILDKYLSDPRAEFHRTVMHERISFHDEDAEDPDWKVKRCYTVMIAAATEVECGIDNLWKSGKSLGRRNFPDFGQYIPIHAFRAFCSAAPYAWCDPKYWYVDKRDRPWDIFLPCLNSMNKKRSELLKAVLLMLDESMSPWCPKTSKLGGLPNITYEKRKPIELGSMLKNAMECTSGVFKYQDIVQAPEQQQRKKFFGEPSAVGSDGTIPSHTAEVLRQVEGSDLADGAWVGGDAWFGSITTAVEVHKKFNVESTWVIKNNTFLFPMEALYAVMKARHGRKCLGHWVVMRTEIEGVDLFVCAYAWSQSSIAYFLSTTGNTTPSDVLYRSQFEDEFGGVGYKDIPRPDFADFLYHYLPLIDEHNKQRQNVLNLEKCWPTRNVWFRLLTTLTGLCLVDFHRLYINQKKKQNRQYVPCNVRKFADLLCQGLSEGNNGWYRFQRERITNPSAVENHLERITNSLGQTNREPTPNQQRKNRMTGNPITKNCYICRMFLKPNGETDYNTTQWQCNRCHMPICSVDRSQFTDNSRRNMSCLDLHLREVSPQHPISCKLGQSFTKKTFPPNLQLRFTKKREHTAVRLKRGKSFRAIDLVHEQTHPAKKKKATRKKRKSDNSEPVLRRSKRVSDGGTRRSERNKITIYKV